MRITLLLLQGFVGFLILILKTIDIKFIVEVNFTAQSNLKFTTQNNLKFYPSFVKVFNFIFTLIYFPIILSVHFLKFHYIL